MENNDISGALGKLLEDPAALARVMNLASTLMSGMPSNTAANSGEPSDAEHAEAPADDKAAASSDAVQASADARSDANGSDDMSSEPSVAALAQILGGGKNDPRCALLYALKPYMSHGRADKIDTLVNMLRLADLAGGMLGGKLF